MKIAIPMGCTAIKTGRTWTSIDGYNDTLIGDNVYNHKDEPLGDIKEIRPDVNNGRSAYAVLSFGGFFVRGVLRYYCQQLFTVPRSALKLDTANKRFLLNVDKERPESPRDSIRMIDRIWRIRPGGTRY
jgi:hypothetical protein